MSAQPAEQALAGLGVEIELEPNQQIVDAIVLARVTDFRHGGTALAVGVSPGVDWILQEGLLHAALRAMADTMRDEDPGHAA